VTKFILYTQIKYILIYIKKSIIIFILLNHS